MEKQRINFKKIDELVIFRDHAAKMAVAKRLGFDQISRAYVEMYRRNVSPKTIGEHFDVTARSVRKHLKDWGVKMRPSGGSNNPWIYDDECLDCGKETEKGDGRFGGRCRRCGLKFRHEQRRKGL